MEPVKYLLQIDNLTIGYLSLLREKAEEIVIAIFDDKEKSLGKDIYPSTFYKSIYTIHALFYNKYYSNG